MSHPQGPTDHPAGDPSQTAEPLGDAPDVVDPSSSAPVPAAPVDDDDDDATAFLLALEDDDEPDDPPSSTLIDGLTSPNAPLSGIFRRRAVRESISGMPAVGAPSSEEAEAPPAMVGVISLEKEGVCVHVHVIASDESLIGREDPSSDIFPELDLTAFDDHLNVSRRHAVLRREADRFFLEPLSGNGTEIDSLEVPVGQSAPLASGAVIVLAGKLRLIFELHDADHASELAASAPSAPPPSKVELFIDDAPLDDVDDDDLEPLTFDADLDDLSGDLEHVHTTTSEFDVVEVDPEPEPYAGSPTDPELDLAMPAAVASEPEESPRRTLPPVPPPKTGAPSSTGPRRGGPPKPPPAPRARRPKGDEMLVTPQQLRDLMAGGRADEAPDLEDLNYEDNNWHNEVFNEDYFRTLPKNFHRQTVREGKFINDHIGLADGSRILDLCCGFGRHTIELAKYNYDMVGLDLSMPLLQKALNEAQRRSLSIKFIHGDMRQLNFDSIFDGIINFHTSFGYFSDQANFKVLQGIHKALKPGGRFLLELVNRDFISEGLPMRIWWAGMECLVLEEVDLDYSTSVLHVKRSLVFDDSSRAPWEQFIRLRLYSAHEINAMLRRAGFRIISLTGDYNYPGSFFGNASRRLIVLAERPFE